MAILRRTRPFIGYHHVLMTIIAIAIMCHCLLLVGCSPASATFTRSYVLGLRYSDSLQNIMATNPIFNQSINVPLEALNLQVRAGYFGICVQDVDKPWVCARAYDYLPLPIRSTPDPYNILNTIDEFRSGIIFPGLILISDILALGGIIGLFSFPGWREEVDERTGETVDVKHFPSRYVASMVFVALGFASTMAFSAALWQHTSASAIASLVETTSHGTVRASVGVSGAVLAWMPFSVLALTSFGTLIMVLSIIVLERLTEED